MAKIVIDMPNSLYANLQKIHNGSIASGRILEIVKKGTVLPKGHGRLIEADEVSKGKFHFECECDCAVCSHSRNCECDLINSIPTVIEADKDGDADG